MAPYSSSPSVVQPVFAALKMNDAAPVFSLRISRKGDFLVTWWGYSGKNNGVVLSFRFGACSSRRTPDHQFAFR
jgi:hypothetical protein